MSARTRLLAIATCAAALCAFAGTAAAQVEDQVSVYTGENAKGYLEPLSKAIGADLTSAVWTTAYIPEEDAFHLSFETRVVGLIFGDDMRTFTATTEGGFSPETTEEVPTVIGDGDAIIVQGNGSSSFAFPGGFDVNSFTLAVPQLRIGSYKGTEAMIRYFAVNTGDVDIGDISLYGFGVHHSISQYMGPDFPMELAAGVFYQKLQVGDDLMDATAYSFGVQASRRYPAGFAIFEPYGSLAVDMFSMDVAYESDTESVDISYDTDTSVDFTVGLNLHAAFFHLNGEYSISGQNTFAFGFGLGF
ncbi:MAG: hypothetical protein GF400_04885 [Candidatus Eisenbacteria bacterium]|nr:hypothetical protein [Candidatus Eisenbacteria bacterium]